MAKRAAPDEKPYRPLLDADLVNAALAHVAPEAGPARSGQAPATVSGKVLEMPRADSLRRAEPVFADLAPEPAEPHFRSSESDRARETIQAVVEKFDQEKRILFTRPEAQAIDRLVVSLATRLNAQVKVSHVIRALVGLLLHAEAAVDKRAGEISPLVRPANGDAQGLQRFEREIGKIIAAALRDAGPPR